MVLHWVSSVERKDDHGLLTACSTCERSARLSRRVAVSQNIAHPDELPDFHIPGLKFPVSAECLSGDIDQESNAPSADGQSVGESIGEKESQEDAR